MLLDEDVAGLEVAVDDAALMRVMDRVADVGEVAATHPDGALFLLTAPTHDELIEVAERGEVMPPKSTYIEPKPRAGIFLHPRQGPVDPRDLPGHAASGASWQGARSG